MKKFISLIFLTSSLLFASGGTSCTNANDLGVLSNSGFTTDTGRIDKNNNPRYAWWKFTAPDAPNGEDYVGIKINYQNTDKQREEVNVRLYSGACNSLAQIESANLYGKQGNEYNDGNRVQQNLQSSELEPGTDYYIRFADKEDDRTNYQLSINFYDVVNTSTTFKHAHPKEFTVPLYQKTLVGDLLVIGNSNYCTDFDRDDQCDIEGTTSLTSGNQAGNVIPIISETTTTIATDGNLPIAISSNTSFDNQSIATLTTPPDSKIKWAGLFWQGTIEDSSNLEKEPNGVLDERREAARNVYFKTPISSHTSLTSAINPSTNINDDDTKISDFRWLYYHDSFQTNENDVGNTEPDARGAYSPEYGAAVKSVNLRGLTGKDAFLYQGFVDVTDMLQAVETANGSADGQYTVSNITSDTGYVQPVGVLGAWSLMVVYEDVSGSQYKNITVSDGFLALYDARTDDAIMYAKLNADPRLSAAEAEKTASGGEKAPSLGFYHRSVEFELGGFYTPKAPAIVNSTLSLFMGDGEGSSAPEEKIWLAKGGSAIGTGATGVYNEIDNGDGWNGAITKLDGSDNIDRSPNLRPVMAIDIRNFPAELSNEQTETSIKMEIGGDRMLVGVFGFSTDIYVPQLCYDYAYSQNGLAITEDNNGSTNVTPYIRADLLNDEPIETRIFLRNNELGSEAEDIIMYLRDMNTTQAEFPTNLSDLNLTRTEPNSIIYNGITPSYNSASDVTYDYADLLGYGEGVYSQFNVQPLSDGPIEVPLNMFVDFNFTIAGSTFELSNLPLRDRVPLCTGGNFAYNPDWSIFNVEDRSLAGTSKYNLYTQVAKRPYNVDITSYESGNNPHTAKPLKTMVAIELIDASLFHDVNVSCQDPNAAITPRVWVILGDQASDSEQSRVPFDLSTAISEGLTEFTDEDEFYGVARENAAFRISYNATNDGNSSLIRWVADGSGYQIENFTELVQNISTCVRPVEKPNGNGTTNQVANACGNAGGGAASAITPRHFRICQECLFGYNTKRVCSRDNFSIRPESFKIKIYDNNSSVNALDPTYEVPTVANLAAGYDYRYDVNATSHKNDEAVNGYVQDFRIPQADHNITYYWRPEDTRDVSGCNDITDKSPSIYLINGIAQNYQNKSDNVGQYELEMRDKIWTQVDQSAEHHTDNPTYFNTSADCSLDESYVPHKSTILTNTNVGCTISSKHTNQTTGDVYTDYNITMKPYQFNLGALSFNKGDITNTTSVGPNNAYVYSNNLLNANDDLNMSVRYTGTIRAEGKDSGLLSNFVTACYAEDLRLDINTSDLPAAAALPSYVPNFSYRLRDKNISGEIINDNIQGNNGSALNLLGLITLGENSFFKDMNGRANIELNLNFDRLTTNPINPIRITFNDFNTTCATTSECSRIADMETADAYGDSIQDQELIFVYARAHVPRHRVEGSTANVNFSYEFYCDNSGLTLPNNCNIIDYTTRPSLTNPLSANAQLSPDGVRWYLQTEHNTNVDGNVTFTRTRTDNDYARFANGTNITLSTDATSATYIYDGNDNYPFKTTIQMNTPDWLIYNRFDTSATINNGGNVVNNFELEFTQSGGWTGEDASGMQVDTNASSVTNRRIQW